MSGDQQEAYEVRIYSNMVQVMEDETFGDVRGWTPGVADDVPAGAVHQNGERGTFDDEDVVVEELGQPLVGWVIVFEEPPLEEYAEYRYPDTVSE